MSDIKALDIIQGANILTKDDWSGLINLKDELRHTWETVQVFRTRTEMDCSVLDDVHFPTPDAKYWQSIREQNVHFCELVNLSYEYRKKAVELKKLQRDSANETDELEVELKQIEIEQTDWHMKQMERVAHDRIREILEWSDIKEKLIPNMKHGVDDVNAHQLESYGIQFNIEANNMTEHTPPAERANLAGKAITINRVNTDNKKLKLVK
jgi:hypothetical protein